MQNLNGVNLSYLKDKPQFIENLIKDSAGDRLQLDYWQFDWIKDGSFYKAVNKSRQTGFSYGESVNAVADTHLEIGMNHYFVSLNLDESKSKIQYANEAHDSIPTKFKLRKIISTRTELVFEDNHGRRNTIKALTSKEPRGMHGNITLDEFAHYRNARAIFSAASAVGIRGNYRLSVGSTPRGKSGVHWEIITNNQEKYNLWRVYQIPWWYSKGLCKDVKTAVEIAPSLTTAERVRIFGSDKLKNTFSSLTLEEFIQEYECGFVDDAGAYMPFELVQSCWEENYSDDASDENAAMMFRKFEGENGKEPGEEFWTWLRSNKRGSLEMGYDIARSGDLSALVAVDTVRAKREVRAIVVLKNASFAMQEAMIDQAIRIGRPTVFRYDNTSLGMATGESLAGKWGGLFERITFNNSVKSEMATGLKLLFEKGLVTIPAWKVLTDNIRSIQKGLTEKNKLVTFEADANDHHGDIYWAFALACYHSTGEQNIDYSTKGSRIITGGNAPI